MVGGFILCCIIVLCLCVVVIGCWGGCRICGCWCSFLFVCGWGCLLLVFG